MLTILKLYKSEIVYGENINDHELLTTETEKQMAKELSNYSAFIFGSFREVEPYLTDYQYFESNFHKFIISERMPVKSGSKGKKQEFMKEFDSRLEYYEFLAHTFAYKADNVCFELAMGYGIIGRRIHRLRRFFSKHYHKARRLWLREQYGIDILW